MACSWLSSSAHSVDPWTKGIVLVLKGGGREREAGWLEAAKAKHVVRVREEGPGEIDGVAAPLAQPLNPIATLHFTRTGDCASCSCRTRAFSV